jgi:DNA-binding NarL/FixJ family response regulator
MIAPLEPGRRHAPRERAFAAVGPWIGDCSHHTQKKVAPHRSHRLGAVNTVASLEVPDKLFKNGIGAKKSATVRALFALCRIVVLGDTCVSEEGMAAIVGRDRRYHVCGSAHGFYDAGKLIQKYHPDVLLLEPFVEGRDGIRWIKDLTTEYPSTQILIVSRQSERLYAERALHAGAAGYWMKTGSPEELMRAIETVAAGKIYVSPLIASLALEKFAHREVLPKGPDLLTDRELAVFALIAAEQSVGRIAKQLGISRTTVETHCQHIKQKLGYPNAEALKRGARELFGTTRTWQTS